MANQDNITDVISSIEKYLQVGFKKSRVGHEIIKKTCIASQSEEDSLSVHSDQSKELRIKFDYLEETRILAMKQSVSYEELQNKIKKLYGQLLNIFYENPNLIPITDQRSLDKAIALLKGNQSLRLFLSLDTFSGDIAFQETTNSSILYHDSLNSIRNDSIPKGGTYPKPKPNCFYDNGSLNSSGSLSYPGHLRPQVNLRPGDVTEPLTFSNGSKQQQQQQRDTDSREDLSLHFKTTCNIYETCPDSPARWQKGRKLGAGAFGAVFLSYDEDSGRQFAAKEVPIGAEDGSGDTSQEVRVLQGEIQLLKSLKHHRIVQYLGTQQTNQYLYIFMEYVAGGSIRDQLNNFGALNERNCRKWTRQVLEGLEYLHSIGIVHRDVKGANILRTTNGDIKLGDFGASKRLETIRSTMTSGGLNTFVGTAYWIAPEVINNCGYGRKADIWSLGCTVVEMLTTNPPFASYESIAAIFQIANGDHPSYELPASTSQQVHDFLLECFQRVPAKRPSSNELLKHIFLSVET